MAFGQKCDAKVPKKNLSSLAWFSRILHTFSLTACLITARVRKEVAKRQTGFLSHECRSCQSGGAWPFLVGGVICLVNSVNEETLTC